MSGFLMVFSVIGVVAQEPKVRAAIGTQGDLWVGQRVTLTVDLLAPGFFSGVAAFDLPNPPGLLLVPPEGSPLVSSETIDDTSYTVQRHEVAVFARRPGAMTIPPFTVRFHFKRNPLDKDPIAAAVKTAPISFTAKLPPGAENLGGIISARNLKVEETWEPEPGKAKAGDAFTRTITYTAPDVPAMAFPPFPADKIDGIGVYAKTPEVRDQMERGALRGERRQVITYVCERPGQFTIPETRFTWWNLESKQLETIDFPAHSLDVVPNPAFVSETNETAPPARWNSKTLLDFVAVAVVLAAITIALWRNRRSLQQWFHNALDFFRPTHLAPLNPGRDKAAGQPNRL